MNKDELMMRTIDQIILHSKAFAILQRKDIPYAQAYGMISEMMRHYEFDSEAYYCGDDEDHCVRESISDEQELINDDNKERAADMNAVNRSYY